MNQTVLATDAGDSPAAPSNYHPPPPQLLTMAPAEAGNPA